MREPYYITFAACAMCMYGTIPAENLTNYFMLLQTEHDNCSAVENFSN